MSSANDLPHRLRTPVAVGTKPRAVRYYVFRDGSITLQCPRCGSRDVREADVCTRWNSLVSARVEDGALMLTWSLDSNADAEHEGYVCAACGGPLTLPKRFELVEDWE